MIHSWLKANCREGTATKNWCGSKVCRTEALPHNLGDDLCSDLGAVFSSGSHYDANFHG